MLLARGLRTLSPSLTQTAAFASRSMSASASLLSASSAKPVGLLTPAQLAQLLKEDKGKTVRAFDVSWHLGGGRDGFTEWRKLRIANSGFWSL